MYDQNKTEQTEIQDETPVHSALAQAQRQGEALYELFHCIQIRKVPTPKEL